MGYRHIENLYRNNSIKLFRECYAMEKVHGTSANIHFDPIGGKTRYHPGGVKHESFVKLFDDEKLRELFTMKELPQPVTVYGEAYGGSCQAMSDTYGKELQFIGFEVLIGDKWLNVDRAQGFVESLGLEFVPYKRIETTDEQIDAERDRPSRVAVRRGCGDDKISEGVVLRPLVEVTLNCGGRIMCKHKRPEFSERKSKRDTILDPNAAWIRENAAGIAEEWVTPMRLNHVVDKWLAEKQTTPMITDTGDMIARMFEDVSREGKDEFTMTDDVRKAICRQSALMFKRWLSER